MDNNQPQIQPCRHMHHWIQGFADGSLTGFARWYTRLHVSGCPRCREAVQALAALRDRLKALGSNARQKALSLSPERRTALESALDRIEEETPPSKTMP